MSEDRYKKIFSDNLKYYMELNGKTQVDIVKDLHFDKSAVSTWVLGTRLPRMDKVNALASYFHIKRSDLIEMRDTPAAGSGSIREVREVSDEAMHIARAYDSAPEGIKDSVAKLLDVKRADTTGLVAHYSA